LPRGSAMKKRAFLLGAVVSVFFLGKTFFDIHSGYHPAVSAAKQHAKALATALNEHALPKLRHPGHRCRGRLRHARREGAAAGARRAPETRVRAGSPVRRPSERCLHAISSRYPVSGFTFVRLDILAFTFSKALTAPRRSGLGGCQDYSN
jgi:hypothetical protein